MPLLLAAVLALPLPRPESASVAWVRAEADNAGAGFVVDRGRKWIVTCRHVVGDRDRVDVFFPWVRDGEVVTESREYLANRARLRELGLLVTGTVLRRSDAADLALVELPTLPPSAAAFQLATHAVPGEPVWAVGHRTDLDTVWNLSAGHVRQTGRLTDGYFWRSKKLAAGARAVLAQLPTEEGDSGGPVVNARGEAVGLVCALRRQASGAAVVVSAAEIAAFAGLPLPDAKPDPVPVPEVLTRGTVWVRPTATGVQCAAVLVAPNLLLTSHRGAGPGDRVGVAFPLREDGRVVGERDPYRDPVGLYLKGAWRAGTVVARDRARDLAVIRVDSVPAGSRPLPLATDPPAVGEAVHATNHPAGVEFAWVYAAGVVRQRGRVPLAEGGDAATVPATVFQLPSQGNSPGGPVANDRGELVGVLAAREGVQQVGYAADIRDVAAVLAVARMGLLPGRPEVAVLFAYRAEEHRAAGRTAEAEAGCETALAIDPTCPAARLCRARIRLAAGRPDDALAELDAAERGPFDRGVLLLRAELWRGMREAKRARADLERILDPHPEDAAARQELAAVLHDLGEDEKAAAAVADALRMAPGRLPSFTRDWLRQADALAKTYPDSPGRAAAWLARVLTAARAVLPTGPQRDAIDTALTPAGATDAERLKGLRAAVEGMGK